MTTDEEDLVVGAFDAFFSGAVPVIETLGAKVRDVSVGYTDLGHVLLNVELSVEDFTWMRRRAIFGALDLWQQETVDIRGEMIGVKAHMVVDGDRDG